jgi:Asp-tRNA(Asn)/Glu-tRNA(Gln) amidotransferase A subunit family amidase
VIGGEQTGMMGSKKVRQAVLESDPGAEAALLGPRRRMRAAYAAELDRLKLDGLVYPAIQMPPVDETMPQDGTITGGPHSDTGWVNMLGVPAISIPAGFYDDGLPFGIEFSARPWRDGDLISWAYDYEQRTHHRRRPVLVEGGMLPNATKALEP